MRPPSAPASSRAIGRPSPVPWLSREMNGMKMRSRSSRLDARAGVRHVDADDAVRRSSSATPMVPPSGVQRNAFASRFVITCSTRSPSVTIVGASRILVEREVDLAAPRLLAEARVRLLDERADVDLLGVHREPVRVAASRGRARRRRAARAGSSRSRRRRATPRSSSGSSKSPSRIASTWPLIAVSGVRSSCETDIRNWRSRSSVAASRAAISLNRSERWLISSPPPPTGTRTA